MKKSLILSILLAGMTPNLPFWRFDSEVQPFFVAAVTFMIAFVNIYPDEVMKHD